MLINLHHHLGKTNNTHSSLFKRYEKNTKAQFSYLNLNKVNVFIVLRISR